jgi:hypothetical protein
VSLLELVRELVVLFLGRAKLEDGRGAPEANEGHVAALEGKGEELLGPLLAKQGSVLDADDVLAVIRARAGRKMRSEPELMTNCAISVSVGLDTDRMEPLRKDFEPTMPSPSASP